MTSVATSVISGRISRPKTPKSWDFTQCQRIVLVHFLFLLPMSSILHHRCPPPSLDHQPTFCWPVIDYDTMSTIAMHSYPWVWVGFVPPTELKLTSCHFSSHSVDFVSLRSPQYHHAPVGLKASRSVFPDLVFLSLLILPGHHPSYIDVYSCLHSFEPHTHINHYRFFFSIGILSSLLFHYISSRLRYIFWSLMLNSQCSNHHSFNLLVTCIAHNNLSIVTVLPAICTACYDPSTNHMLKQYSTLCSGTATPTHLLGGVHREDDSGSWLRAVILCQRCLLFIYYNKCDVWLDHMTCDMCCLF